MPKLLGIVVPVIMMGILFNFFVEFAVRLIQFLSTMI